jgi:hypothetical protein
MISKGGCMAPKTTHQEAIDSIEASPYRYIGMPTDNQRRDINEAVVEIIKYALYGKKKYPKPKDTYSPSFNYLLNQSIRQYIIPEQNIHITEAANNLWNQLFTASNGDVPDIRVYAYQDTNIAQSDMADLAMYSGRNNQSTNTNVVIGQKVKFNSFFIQEHTTPVADMIAALEELQARKDELLLGSEDVVKVLDKMHITQMLKREDKGIKNAKHRINADNILAKKSEEIFDDIIHNEEINYPPIHNRK